MASQRESGLGLDNLVASSAGLACLGEVSYEQVRYGQSVVWPDSEELCCCCFFFNKDNKIKLRLN